MASKQTDEIKLAVMANDIVYIKDQIREVNQKVSSNYVTIEQHANTLRRIKLLEKIVYGMVGLMAVAVFGALLNLVVAK